MRTKPRKGKDENETREGDDEEGGELMVDAQLRLAEENLSRMVNEIDEARLGIPSHYNVGNALTVARGKARILLHHLRCNERGWRGRTASGVAWGMT